MGSKRSMLRGSLGETIGRELPGFSRFVDLFAGTGVVSFHVAESYPVQVQALDLQQYSVILARSVLERTCRVEAIELWNEWSTKALNAYRSDPLSSAAEELDVRGGDFDAGRYWSEAKKLCKDADGTITRAYGGFYFSPRQALIIDALLSQLPSEVNFRDVCLASLIKGASKAVASPGHTAQPFKATASGAPSLLEAWRRDVWLLVRVALRETCDRFAMVQGHADAGDAVEWTNKLTPNDLVFIDPPYSGVHYSRFYHVLESIARGQVGEVSGEGRYPASAERPRSRFSMRTTSQKEFQLLLEMVASKGAKAIVTYPSGDTSNGLAGSDAKEVASTYFKVEEHRSSGRFSTLGGNGKHREARQASDEMILVLNPK